MQQYESESDQFAADTLIPLRVLAGFVRSGIFTNKAIHGLGEEEGIGPGILISRLQHDSYLAPHQDNALKQSYGGKLSRVM